MKKLVVALACVLPFALAACDSDAPQALTPTWGTATTSLTAYATASSLAASQLRTPIPLPSPIGNGLATVLPTWTPDSPGATPVSGVLRLPSSGRVTPGQAYIFGIYTHCGLDGRVDFDGSFWDVVAPVSADNLDTSLGLSNPGQQGTMTLIGANRARFEFPPVTYTTADNRQRTFLGGSLDFTRHVGPEYVPSCY